MFDSFTVNVFSDVEDSGRRDTSGYSEEEEDIDEGEESPEEPVQSTSLDKEGLWDPGQQITNTRYTIFLMQNCSEGLFRFFT